jgi:hypothetical protein
VPVVIGVSDFLARVATKPTLRQRVIVSALIGIWAAAIIGNQYTSAANFHTDFGVSWFGARSLLHRIDPYPLVGHGAEFNYRWPLVYPGPSLVALIPLAFVSEKFAAIVFVGLSAFLLAIGVTRNSWHLLPLFITEPFLNAVRLGQWNIFLTAAIYFPALAFFGSAKPQAIIPIVAASIKKSTTIWLICGTVCLLSVSFLILPGWWHEWLAAIAQTGGFQPIALQYGGFLVLFALTRWRRPETWLLLALAAVPQRSAYYSALPLFTIPVTFGESIGLAFITMVGGLLGTEIINKPRSPLELDSFVATLQIYTIFVPAVFLILRRTNEGPSPVWLQKILLHGNSIE